MSEKIRITSTAGKALNLLPNKKGEYTLPSYDCIVTGKQVEMICAHYETLIRCRLDEQKEILISQLNNKL